MAPEGVLRLVQSQPEGTFLISRDGIVVQRRNHDGELRWKSCGHSTFVKGYSDSVIANSIVQDFDNDPWSFS